MMHTFFLSGLSLLLSIGLLENSASKQSRGWFETAAGWERADSASFSGVEN